MPGTTLLALRILMSTEFARAICLGEFFMAPEPEKAKILWDAKIYDASVAFFTVDQKIDESIARKFAGTGASRETKSFSFGACPVEKVGPTKSDKSWLAIFTAPASAIIIGEKLIIPLPSPCAATSVRWVGTAGVSRGLEKIREKSEDGGWLLPAKDGIVTVTCGHDQPSVKASDLGPELWFSIPTGKGPPNTVPHQKLLGPSKDPQKAFLAWINAVRDDEKKVPLKMLDEASALAGVPDLTSKSTPFHDRDNLKKIKKLAREKLGLEMIGEDRVVAATLLDSAWLFWNSPRHRDLLLSQKSSRALIQINTKKGITLSAVLFAK